MTNNVVNRIHGIALASGNFEGESLNIFGNFQLRKMCKFIKPSFVRDSSSVV